MPQQPPVTVAHGGLTITTNTASEADLRAELTRDEKPSGDAPESSAPPAAAAPPETAAAPPTGPVRDAQGRFVKTGAPPAPALPDTAEPAPEPEAPPARRRDDTLPRHN